MRPKPIFTHTKKTLKPDRLHLVGLLYKSKITKYHITFTKQQFTPNYLLPGCATIDKDKYSTPVALSMPLSTKCKQRKLRLGIGLLATGLSTNLLWSGVQEGEIAQIRSQLFDQQKFNLQHFKDIQYEIGNILPTLSDIRHIMEE